jgi:hypothetical protein
MADLACGRVKHGQAAWNTGAAINARAIPNQGQWNLWGSAARTAATPRGAAAMESAMKM